MLLFNCNKPRSPRFLLEPFADALKKQQLRLDHVIFCVPKVMDIAVDQSNVLAQANYTNTSWQKQIADEWNALIADWPGQHPNVHIMSSVNLAYEFFCNLTKEPKDSDTPQLPGSRSSVEVLVTGSLYLVGAILQVVHYPTVQD